MRKKSVSMYETRCSSYRVRLSTTTWIGHRNANSVMVLESGGWGWIPIRQISQQRFGRNSRCGADWGWIACVPCDSCDGTGVIDDGKIRERRFYAEHNGVTISGAVDLIDGGVVTDYKVTSAYSVKRGLKQDWERQLNLYAWLLRQNDMTATKLNIVCICRDWMKSRAGKSDYPDSPVVVLSVPVWRDGRQDDYVDQRIRLHTQESTIPCTPEERWARGAYQVNPMHSGGGRPRSFDTLQDATDYINKQKSGSYKMVDGNAKYVRCEDWCEVAPFCPQWKGDKGNGR